MPWHAFKTFKPRAAQATTFKDRVPPWLKSSLGGLKTLHHLMDIGKPGWLRVRVGSCHRCKACQCQDYGNCTDLQFVGQTEVIQLRPKESARVYVSAETRSTNWGKSWQVRPSWGK